MQIIKHYFLVWGNGIVHAVFLNGYRTFSESMITGLCMFTFLVFALSSFNPSHLPELLQPLCLKRVSHPSYHSHCEPVEPEGQDHRAE